jgi:hypothetical protein
MRLPRRSLGSTRAYSLAIASCSGPGCRSKLLRGDCFEYPGNHPRPAAGIVMKKGAAVPIRIDDAGQFLPRHEGRTPGAHLLIGVTTQQRTLRVASTVSRDETGRTQQVVIPFDTPLRIMVASSLFRLVDGSGASLTGSGAMPRGIPLIVPAGQRSATIRLAVTGGN